MDYKEVVKFLLVVPGIDINTLLMLETVKNILDFI